MAERFISLSTVEGVVEWTHSPALERLTSKYRLVHGGSLKPRPDHNNGTYLKDDEKKEETERPRVQRSMGKADIHEALLGESHEVPSSFLAGGTVELPKDVQNGPLEVPIVDFAPKLKTLLVE